MRFVKFKTTSYKLASTENVSIDRLQVTILKDDAYTIEQIVEDASDVTTVTILEDEEVVGVYNGYTDLLATVLRVNQVIDSQGTTATTISVELLNADFQSQINQLAASLNTVQSTQNSQSEAIVGLTNEVNGKLDSSVIGDVETIGSPSLKAYKVDDTFMGSDGKYYKATAAIMVNSVLVVGGNCEETSVANEVK